MPQSIQAALSVIDQVAPNLSDDHVAELKKKLPPIALHFERAGRPLSKAQITDYASRPLEVFRAAASSLTQKQGQESQRSYDDIAANFAAQREEKILQAMGPWCAVIEGADLELAKKLVADETPFPDQRDVQDEMILRLMDEQRQDIFKLLAQSGRIIAPERLGEGGGHYDIFRLNVRRLLFGLYGNRISNKLSYAHIALLLDMWPGLAEDMMIKDHLLKRLAIQGNLENFKRIYERYFSPMHPDTRIITCAAENGHFDIVKYLCDLYAKEDKGLPLCSLSGITDTSIKQYLEKLMGQGAQKGKADGDSTAKAKQQADAQYATEMLSVLRWHNEQLPVLAKSAPPEVMQHMLLSLIEHLGIEQKSSGYGAYVRSMTSYDDPQRPLDLAELYQRELNMNWMTGLKIGSDKYKVLDALIGQNARFLIAFVKELKALKAQLLRISIKDAVIPMGFYHSNVGAIVVYCLSGRCKK